VGILDYDFQVVKDKKDVYFYFIEITFFDFILTIFYGEG